MRGSPLDVKAKMLDCGLKLHDYFHFWANTLGKGMNPLITPAIKTGFSIK